MKEKLERCVKDSLLQVGEILDLNLPKTSKKVRGVFSSVSSAVYLCSKYFDDHFIVFSISGGCSVKNARFS